MTGGVASFRARRIGNWTHTSFGNVFALPPDLAQAVVTVVPNRADRRRAERDRGHDRGAS